MNWSIIWELTKINLLYSNPQVLTAVKKKKAKHPDDKLSTYKAVLKSQLLSTVIFLFIYIFMFLGIDFKQYPGYFTYYVALFFVLSTVTCFTALYTIFYDSNDLKLYSHLPIKSSEIYIAKAIAALGMGSMFLMPIIPLFFIAYWQILGNPFLALLLTPFLFLVLFASSLIIALYLNSVIGKVILKSPRRQLISALLLFVSTFGSIALIFLINITNNMRMTSDSKVLADRDIIPYFIGYHSIISQPFSLQTLVHFWLPLMIVIVLGFGIYSKIMPHYYQDALYSTPSEGKRKKKIQRRDYSNESLRHVMIRHHLSTLQNATLLTQTFIMPLIFVISFLYPVISNAKAISQFLTADYFGISMVIGSILAIFGTTPSTFLGVGISLEKENFTYLKTLPISLKSFIKEKYLVLYACQAVLPLIVYTSFVAFVLHLHIVHMIALVISYLLMSFVFGQLMFKRDYNYLYLNWQDMTQLFTRGGNQWYMMGMIFGGMILSFIIIGLAIYLSNLLHAILAVNILLGLLVLWVIGVLQIFVKKSFWNRLDHIKEL